ncbi:hypothetical protein F5878DRAFT_247604 [Lentinula raphanica]|uniref:Trichome birefringence-like C-terminal domain-containing protein n=1 Tax=Lentinula raphanica TaxID=153919 RepID=A0AA38P5V0_9AGAR|nr:hypothetical protein C8R42DRAFT_595631 [Lentinula raphanica]KAJ3836741.1 hypothetical protein F5878DRAFT_247604 [Lentinula raphanica]
MTPRSKLRIPFLLLSAFLFYNFHHPLANWILGSSRVAKQSLRQFNFPEGEEVYDATEIEEQHDVIKIAPAAPPPLYCQSYECGRGRWHPRKDPFKTLQDVQIAYSNLWHPVWDGCGIYDPFGELDGEEKKKVEGQRLVDTLNWEWVPGRGLLLEYDPVDFVVRMLKSPGGLVLVGDSISRQHWHAIYYTFRHLNITFDSNPKHLPLAGVANVEQFVLSKTSAMTKILQEKAGVPQSRMERPFFTLLEDHMGLGETDIRAITNAKPNYNWYHKFRRVEGWEDHLKWLAKPRSGEEASVTEDTLVMINAGAHWSRHELAMLRAPTDKQEQALLEDTYPRMIDLVTSRLSPIERTSIYYRSTSPGHPKCEEHTLPYKDMADARLQEQNLVQRLKDTVSSADEKKQRSRWDWDLFKAHNELWNRTIHVMNERRPAGAKGAKWHYFDVWDVSMQRPDAHLEPGKDCLHWCLPTIFDDWTRMFYHRVKLDEGRVR